MNQLTVAKVLMLSAVLLGIGWGFSSFGGAFGLLSGGIVGGAAGALAVHIYHEFLAAYDRLQERTLPKGEDED
jgi:hypothetical protein